MAITVRPTNRQGTLELVDNWGRKVGTGRAHKSRIAGYVTIVLKPEGGLAQVYRVPIDWVGHLQELGEIDWLDYRQELGE